jgi:septal ring factor EnvC (AmiA/AmiB activator)
MPNGLGIRKFLLLASFIFFNVCFAPVYAARLTTNHLEELKQSLTISKQQQTQLQTQLQSAEVTLSALSEDISKLDQKLLNIQNEMEKLRKSQQVYTEKLNRQRAALAQLIQLAYKLGKAQSLKIILNPEDMNSMSRHIFYYHALSDARLNSVAEINQVLGVLNTNLASIRANAANLKYLLQQKKSQQQKLQLAQTKRQQIIKILNVSNSDKKHQIETLLANQNGLKNMLQGLQAHITPLTLETFANTRGKLSWPIQKNIAVGHSFENSDSHQGGIIIRAPEGTPVHAIFGGKVIFANWLRGFGLLIIINHGDGYMSLYARNHAIYAKAGDSVKAQETIASTGNTGGYSHSSLYFEIRQNGVPINPNIWCR